MSFPGQMHVTKAQVSWTLTSCLLLWKKECAACLTGLYCPASLGPKAPRCGGMGIVSSYEWAQPGWPWCWIQKAFFYDCFWPGVAYFFHWTLNAAFCNMGKGARGLNSVGRRKGGWISDLLHLGEQANVTLVLVKEKVISEAWNANWDSCIILGKGINCLEET